MIDTHAHIYDHKFLNNLQHFVTAATTAGVHKILMPNCALETIDIMLQCEQQYPDVCIPMMGLHPCYVADSYQAELQVVAEWLGKKKFCAVGEIGLDYHWDLTYVAEQKIAFIQQIELAIQHSLPIVVHSRDSMDDSIATIAPYISKGLRGVFHCFSGTIEQAQQLIDFGFYLGIGGVVTYPKAGLDAIVAQLPMEYLLLETDAPYLAPVPFRGKPNQVDFIVKVAEKIAEVKGISLQEVDEITTKNAIQLFKI